MHDPATRHRRAPARCRAAGLVLSVWACSGGQTGEGRAAPAAAPVEGPAAPAAAPAPVGLPRPAPPAKVRGQKLLEETTSPFSTIRVRQQGGRRTLAFVRERGDEFVQTTVDLAEPDVPTHVYIEMMAAPLLVVDDPRRLLVIGLGGGNLVRMLHARLPAASIDAVEIDPEVVRLAGKWFGVAPGPRLRVFTEDAARFVGRPGEAYDVIWVDAFLDPGASETDSAGVPEALRGAEFLRQLRARLRPGGVAAFNIHYLSGYREHVDAIASVFPRVEVARSARSNELIVLGLARAEPLTGEALRARAAALDASGAWKVSFATIAEGITPWTPAPPG